MTRWRYVVKKKPFFQTNIKTFSFFGTVFLGGFLHMLKQNTFCFIYFITIIYSAKISSQVSIIFLSFLLIESSLHRLIVMDG